MKQIGILYVIIFLTAMSLSSCLEKNTSQKDFTRPNIVWLVLEDQSPDFFSFYGDSTISLPNIESLANEGLIFDRAYAPVPVCAPARSSIITGMYPTTLGTHNMRTFNAYKKENEPSIDVPSYSPIVPDGVRPFTDYLRMEGYYCSNAAKEDYNFKIPESAWDESSKDAHWRKRKELQPFFSVFNFNVCHESGIWLQGENGLFVSPDSVPVPPYFPDDSIIKKDLAVNYSNLKRADDKIGVILQQLKEEGLLDNTIIIFYGDHGGPFPRHKRALYESGTKVPMIVRFPESWNTTGRDNRFFSFIDLAPTMLSLAGIKPASIMQGKALFGMHADESDREFLFTTSDRFDEVYDRIRAVRGSRFKYIKNFRTDLPYALPVAYREQMPMMRRLRELKDKGELNDEQMLWMAESKPTEELYDLENDPFELNNLVANSHYIDTLKKYRNVIENWMLDTKDLGATDERNLINRWLSQGTQPKLSEVIISTESNSYILSHDRADVTILWREMGQKEWKIYQKPLSLQKNIQTKAVRIGYEDSEMVNS